MFGLLERSFEKIEGYAPVQAVRNGLVSAIPILLIGSFALVLYSLPIAAYQQFITSFAGGFLYALFHTVHSATFGMLSLYVVLTVSTSYAAICSHQVGYIQSSPITSLACFALCSGFLAEDFDLASFGAKGMFVAIFSALTAPRLYFYFQNKIHRSAPLYTAGADVEFNSALETFFPALLTIGAFALGNLFIFEFFGLSGLQQLFIEITNRAFIGQKRSLCACLMYVFFSSLLWMFGIHGSDVLEHVSRDIFEQGVAVNAAAVAAGGQPTELYTKTFLDVFVLMGGCGTTICALFAILLFSRQRTNRKLAKLAALPMLFNINELMVFGMPIVFNPIMFLPFLLTPLVLVFTSSGAMQLGLVPIPVHSVEWTTPILLGGVMATGSWRGAALQLFNVLVGVLLYRPFVLMADRQLNLNAKKRMEDLIALHQTSEKNNIPLTLTQRRDASGTLAKTLAVDLRHALEDGELILYYQPQYDNHGQCLGAEALLRWNHPLFGMVYPPLIIKIAQESGILEQLEQYVFRQAAQDLPRFQQRGGDAFCLCVNVSSITLSSQGFTQFLTDLQQEFGLKDGDLCIELIESAVLLFDDKMKERFAALSRLGYRFAIDDFSMGFTSLKYLQEGQFDLVKLDGSLIREMDRNPRCKNIIESILYLSQSLDFDVLAEYVETPAQQQALEAIGCTRYQGYLFSPALPRGRLVERLGRERQDV